MRAKQRFKIISDSCYKITTKIPFAQDSAKRFTTPHSPTPYSTQIQKISHKAHIALFISNLRHPSSKSPKKKITFLKKKSQKKLLIQKIAVPLHRN